MIRVIDDNHLQVGKQVWWGEFSTEGTIGAERCAEFSQMLGYEFVFERRQFRVRFESKWSVSIIWGSMTYSDNHDHGFGRPPYAEFVETPQLVEAAVLHADRDGIFPDGEPYGYLDAEQLNTLLRMVSALATDAVVDSGVAWDST